MFCQICQEYSGDSDSWLCHDCKDMVMQSNDDDGKNSKGYEDELINRNLLDKCLGMLDPHCQNAIEAYDGSGPLIASLASSIATIDSGLDSLYATLYIAERFGTETAWLFVQNYKNYDVRKRLR